MEEGEVNPKALVSAFVSRSRWALLFVDGIAWGISSSLSLREVEILRCIEGLDLWVYTFLWGVEREPEFEALRPGLGLLVPPGVGAGRGS